MTDDDAGIVGRLRGWRARRHEAGLDYLCNAAADEIERLRDQLAEARKPGSRALAGFEAGVQAERARVLQWLRSHGWLEAVQDIESLEGVFS